MCNVHMKTKDILCSLAKYEWLIVTQNGMTESLNIIVFAAKYQNQSVYSALLYLS